MFKMGKICVKKNADKINRAGAAAAALCPYLPACAVRRKKCIKRAVS